MGEIYNAPIDDSDKFAHILKPQNDDELWDAVRQYVGIEIPREKVCEEHVAPFTAFADAYFARSPVSVWIASRGFGGKSVMLAALGFIEAVTLGASVNLLGGSGEQATRVHEYMKGDEPNLSDKYWGWASAPIELLESDPTKRETKLANLGRIRVLMASQKSVRGPHPQRLRLDEVDEMAVDIFTASLGQAMQARGILDQTVLSSTHHKPQGTMTEIIKMATEKQWPVYKWCYKETATSWLTDEMIARKRVTTGSSQWGVEYDLDTPTGEGLGIDTESIERMFSRDLGVFKGKLGEYIEIEPPVAFCLDCKLEDTPGKFRQNRQWVCPKCRSNRVRRAKYATGADWAKDVDFTDIWTFRTDVSPMMLVAYERQGRKPWPAMISKFNKRCQRYPGNNTHDETGIGKVIADYIKVKTKGFEMIGKARKRLISDYIISIEAGEYIAPYIETVYNEHVYVTNDELYGTGHLPDSICAGALAARPTHRGTWSR